MSFATFAQPGLLSPLQGLQGLLRWFSAGPDSVATAKAGSRSEAKATSTTATAHATQAAQVAQVNSTQENATFPIANHSTLTGTIRVIRSPITPFGGSGRKAAICPSQRETGGQVSRPAQRPAARRVHISRLVEAGQAPANVGRMVISGRMEDVCAELDRLVLREARLH